MIQKAVSYFRVPKKLFYGLLLATAVSATLWSVKPNFHPVDIGTVSEGTFQKMVTDEGVTSFKEKHVISAPADGITPVIELKAGDPVKKGQILLKFIWDMDFKIKSPVDGFVLNVFEKDKRPVPRGTALLEVGDPSEIEIISKLLSEDVIDVKVGQKAQITNWGKDTPLDAVVAKIEPSAKEEISALGVKEQRVKVFLEITSERNLWKNLGDSYRVNVSIITAEKQNARMIPVGAIFSNEGQPSIFTIENKKAKSIAIKIGDRNKDYIELISEIPTGTPVILYPGGGLTNGDRVQQRL